MCMRRPTPLPVPLRDRIFTREEAESWGIPYKRLRAGDIDRLARGIYRHVSTLWQLESSPHTSETQSWGHLRALSQRCPTLWVSHVTAARTYGLLLPARFDPENRTHVTAVHHWESLGQDPVMVLHRAKRVSTDLNVINGVRLSSPGRLFVDLAKYLNERELVSIGDQLVRVPHADLEERSTPLETPEQLEATVRKQRGRPGVVRARAALDLVRVGADSPPETYLRLALLESGLPEPELQVPLDGDDPRSPVGDAGYRSQRIVLQYDGVHHFTAEQQERDQWRNAQFLAAGWTVILVNRVDLRDNFRRAVTRIRHALRS